MGVERWWEQAGSAPDVLVFRSEVLVVAWHNRCPLDARAPSALARLQSRRREQERLERLDEDWSKMKVHCEACCAA